MAYGVRDRSAASPGSTVKIQGRPGRHLCIGVKEGRGSVMIACSPRWYGQTTARVVDEDFNCARCLLACSAPGADGEN